VRLVTVLRLEQRMSNAISENGINGALEEMNHQPRYFIASQEDPNQVNEFLKFVLPIVGPFYCMVWQLLSTLFCAMGVFVFVLCCRIFRAGLRLFQNPRPKARN